MEQADAYEISTDPDRLDRDWIHKALSTDTYWATGRSRERNDVALDNSLCYGVYDADRQVGFARIITDRVTFAWICDVYVDRDARGRGLGKRLMERVVDDLDKMGLRRAALATGDAQELYRRYGFAELDGAETVWMSKQWAGRT
ncbi:GNAT family N-acetyltransferase [Glycomyces albus]